MAASTIDTNVKIRDTLNHGNDSNVIVDILVRANLATYEHGILYLKPPAEDDILSNNTKRNNKNKPCSDVTPKS